MIYIIITSNIKTVGGTQCYVAAKAKCLERMGWKVFILSPSFHSDKYNYPIPFLQKYLDGNFESLAIQPFKLPRFFVKRTLKRIIRFIGVVNDNEEIIIESHEDNFSQWGELLASRLNARHYFYLMNEFYRKPFQTYVDKMGFYSFKFDRAEILGSLKTFSRLFDGFKTINKNDYPGDVVIDESPIQDVYNVIIDKIPHNDWNICYIGRGNKSYVPNILLDVGDFSKKYPNHNIQLIVVGDINNHSRITDIILSNKNLQIIELGLLHPIPKMLFKKVDVVIAGSGSARHSAEEGAVVVVADTETCKSNGLLGYDTNNSIYKDKDSVISDFAIALERVLVDKSYQNMEYKIPHKNKIEDSIKQNFMLFNESNEVKNYFDENKLLDGSIDIKKIVRSLISLYFHDLVNICRNLI